MGVVKVIKSQRLARRWITSVLSIIFVAFLVIEVLASVLVGSYYTNSVSDYLLGEIETITNSFNVYAPSTESEFIDGAKEYAESFKENNKFEIQFLNANNDVVISTSGFSVDKDYIKLENELSQIEDNVVYSGTLVSNEKVLFVKNTINEVDNDKSQIGVVRVIVSLRETNRQIIFWIWLLIIIGFIIFGIIIFSGSFFLGSIITPIRELGEITHQISSGDFDARIKTKKNDEIGDLCESINDMARELGSTEKMKNEFISSVSHELRTPLTAIKGWAETIQGNEDQEITNKGLSVIVSETERLSVLVEDLLDFSRLQNGNITYKFNQCDVIAELSEAVLTYTAQANSAGINLSYSEPLDMPTILGDSSRLQQVFINIIDNAIKYTPSGGAIDIDAKLIDDRIVIMISDNGQGIPEDEVDKVKNKFFKGTNSVRGSGIGLAVADEIISKHNGNMTINSIYGSGTTVTISLPIVSNDTENEGDNNE